MNNTKLNKYKLINTKTLEKSNKITRLTDYEVETFNYAYSLNNMKLKYVKVQ